MKVVRIKDATPEDLANIKFGSLSPEQLKEAHALARAAFTADDLQKFTEIEEGIPMDIVLGELEKAQQEHDRKQRI
jgi:hypothetical protein